jgi:hypothetical protein
MRRRTPATRSPTAVIAVLLACGAPAAGDSASDGTGGGSGAGSGSATDSGGSSGSTGATSAGSGGSDGGGSGSTTGGVACEPWATPWIGGPCGHDDECTYDGGFCLMEAEGFPCGTCSQACDMLCPDLDGAPPTFCVDTADLELSTSEGACISQCDPELLGGDGCRDGYDCVILGRWQDPATTRSVCVPTPVAPDPTDCHGELDARGLTWEPVNHVVESPAGYPGLACEIEDPVLLYGPVGDLDMAYFGDGSDAPVKVACELALRIHDMTQLAAAAGAVAFEHYGTYNCRVISGTSTLSTHGLGLAIDLTGFTLSDQTVYTVFDDWEDGNPAPMTPGGAWLKNLTDALFAMGVFNIILTPNYNAAHDDHVHADLTPGEMFYE